MSDIKENNVISISKKKRKPIDKTTSIFFVDGVFESKDIPDFAILAVNWQNYKPIGLDSYLKDNKFIKVGHFEERFSETSTNSNVILVYRYFEESYLDEFHFVQFLVGGVPASQLLIEGLGNWLIFKKDWCDSSRLINEVRLLRESISSVSDNTLPIKVSLVNIAGSLVSITDAINNLGNSSKS